MNSQKSLKKPIAQNHGDDVLNASENSFTNSSNNNSSHVAPKNRVRNVHNIYIYAIFIVLLLGMAVEYWAAISYIPGINELFFVISNALLFLLSYMDRELIKEKNPHEKLFSLFWILLLPAYLIVRSRFLKQKQYYFVAWLIVLGLSILLSQYIDTLLMYDSLETNDSYDFYY